MSNDFDLNIYNYNIQDIISFMGLKQDFTLTDVTNNCDLMIDVIFENKIHDKQYKNQIIQFIDKAKIKLVEYLKDISLEQEKGFIEDYDKLLIEKDEKNVVNQTSTTYAGHSYIMNKDTTSFNNVINNKEYLNPIETYPTNVSRGILNNLKRKTFFQTIILNTLFREDYSTTSSSDFNIVLPYYFKNVLSIRLSSLQLPNVIYNISASNNNNSFYIEEDVTGIYGTIIMPDGNYGGIEFALVLENEINTQLGIFPKRFFVSHSETTGKIDISNNTHNFGMSFYTAIPTVYKCLQTYKGNEGYKKNECVDIAEIYKKFGWIMGYRNAEYTGSNTYTTEGIYNPAPLEYIYFTLNDYNNSQSQNIFGMFSKSIIGDNILAMIPLTSSSFNVCFDNGADFIEKKREYFGPVKIQKIKIQLLNQYGEIINLNKMDFSFSLELEIGYDY